MYFFLIPLIIGLLLLTVFLFLRAKGQRKIAVIIKGFTSLAFIMTALVAWLNSNPNSNFGIFVLIGLFFGLIGDIALDLKFIYLKHEHLFTVLGFIAFALGHVSYTSGLFINFYDFNRSVLYIMMPLGLMLLLNLITLLMERFTEIRYKNMKPFVIMYGIALFFTVGLSLSLAIQNGWQNNTVNFMFVGLVLFMLSDLILNNTYFAPGYDGALYIISNHILYYFGQFLIAISLIFLL